MQKTERLVILLEPDLLSEIKRLAKVGSQTISEYVRNCLVSNIREHAAQKRTRKLKSLARYDMPLKGIETPGLLRKKLSKKYSND